jgi:hypothetical protein
MASPARYGSSGALRHGRNIDVIRPLPTPLQFTLYEAKAWSLTAKALSFLAISRGNWVKAISPHLRARTFLTGLYEPLFP